MNHNAQSIFTSKKHMKIPVKIMRFLASQSGFLHFPKMQYIGKNSQSVELSFSKKCQENLTKLRAGVENIDNSSPLQKMGKLDKGAALGAGMLGVLAMDPALAENTNRADVHLAAATTTEQVDHCVAFVKEQRELAKENGIVLSRRAQKKLILQCQRGEIQERIAEQEKIIAALRKRLAEQQIILDEQARILDAQGRELARIVAINGQLIIQRQQADKRTAHNLNEVERILKELVSS